MPFQHNAYSINREDHQGTLWSALAIFGSQLEHMVLLNVVWAVQLVPAMMAVFMTALPLPIRALMMVYTIVALPPATAVLYGLCAQTVDEETLELSHFKEQFKEIAWPGFCTLSPLLGSLGLVGWLAVQADSAGITLISVFLQCVLMIMLVTANYWGALLIAYPDRRAYDIFSMSVQLVWQYPMQSVFLGLMVLATSIIGIASAGGLFLAVPVMIVLFQTLVFQQLHKDASFNYIVRLSEKQGLM